jgi:Domain of unknown function (DUF6484)
VWTQLPGEVTNIDMNGQDRPEAAQTDHPVGQTAETVDEGTERRNGAPGAPAVVLGWLVSGSSPGSLLVNFPGNASGLVPARSIASLDDAAIARAVAARQPAALVFENGDPRRPIVLGLLQVNPSPLEDLLRGGLAVRSPSEASRPASLEAHVDGRRVVIRGDQEVTLQCGEASLTLRRDGKILLRGAYVETYARGLNRIKGAQVKIN